MRKRLLNACFTLNLVILLILAGAGGVAFLLPYSLAHAIIDFASRGRNLVGFSNECWNGIQFSGLYVALASAALFLALRVLRSQSDRVICYLPGQELLKDMRSAFRLSRREWVLLGVLCLIGFSCRIWRLGRMLESDEVWTVFTYSRNPIAAVLEYTTVNNHIFHSFLVSIVANIFGDSPSIFRSVSMVSGMLVLPLSIFWARGFGTSVGWLVAGILAVNPLLCEYSAQARGYALQTLLAVSAYFLFDRWTRGKRDVVVMLAVVCALALWTLPTSVYILFAIFLAALFFVRSGRIAASDWIVLAFTTVTIATLLYAPAVLFRGFLDVYHQGTACPASMLPLAVIRGLQGITNPSAMIVGYSDCTHDWAQNFASLLAASTLQTQGALQIVIVSVFLLGLWHAPKSLQLTGCSLFVGVFLHLVIMKHPPPLRIWSFLVPLSATICACGIIFPLWRMNVQARLVSILCICSVMWYWGVCLPMVKQVQPSQSRAEELARIIAKAISKGDRVSLIQFPDKGRTMYIGPIRYYVIHELAKTDSSWNVWRELQSGELPWHKKPRSEICGTEISALEHEFHPEGRCLFAAYMNDGASHFYNLEPEGGKWIYDSSGFVLGWNVQVTPK